MTGEGKPGDAERRIEVEFPGRFLNLAGGRIRIACWPREAQELREELLRVLGEVEERGGLRVYGAGPRVDEP